MIILYISSLISKTYCSGLNWSVPSIIRAHERIDHCLWIDINNAELDNHITVDAFHKVSETGRDLNSIPYPFNNPDIVVFFGVYYPKYLTLAKQLNSNNIPYIIQPASSLTYLAQHNHAFLKKKAANFLLFNRFIKGACAIHYLTEDERRDSGIKWNKHSFVLPNGINIPDSRKTEFSIRGIKACFIGRIDIYQKGLDLLLEAIQRIQGQLRKAYFSLKIFGPIDHDAKKVSSLIKKYSISDIVSLEGVVSGVEKESAFLFSDLFMLTSRFEGHPIALLEALSYGIPVAVTPGTNMAKEVQNYDAGWTCTDNSSESICQMLNTIISEKNFFIEKSRNARKLASQYDWNQIAYRFHDEISKIVSIDEESCDIENF